MKARASNIAIVVVSVGLCLVGCEEEKKPPVKPAPTAAAPPQPTVAAPKPSATASAAPLKDRDDCPEESKGPGTFDKPCEATGKARMMEVTWTGKMTDTGPSFRVVNKSKLPIIYGRLGVYFYDKAGKLLDAVTTGDDSGGKKHPQQWCSGKIFDGPMKAGEKAVITFSCVKKENVPEGAKAIEGEIQMAGFLGEDGKKADFYWRNSGLTPDSRPKGGVK